MGNISERPTKPFFVCSKTSPKRKAKLYEQKEITPISIPCEFCSLMISIEYHDSHAKECPSRPENINVNCDHCRQTYNINFLEYHTGECTENPENIKFNCQHCSQIFNALTAVQHVDLCICNPKNIHVECEFCKEEMTEDIYPSHQKTCMSNPENIKISCEMCNESISVNQYTIHLETCQKKHKMLAEAKIIEKQCSICLEQLTNPKATAYLVCLHKFHTECIQSWSKVHNICPICRTRFV